MKAGDKGHIQDMLDYIGTREGAVLNIQNEKDEIFKPLSKKTEEKEVTKKQKELIDTIMKKYEDMSELPEYDLYMENQKYVYCFFVHRRIDEIGQRIFFE